jgi:hypothetical protein
MEKVLLLVVLVLLVFIAGLLTAMSLQSPRYYR